VATCVASRWARTFKFAEFKVNESIKLVKNRDYWKKGCVSRRHRIHDHADRSTRMLSFVSGRFDMTFPTDVSVPLLRTSARRTQAQCTMRATGVSTT